MVKEMSEWENELHTAAKMIRLRLEMLRESGMTYISKHESENTTLDTIKPEDSTELEQLRSALVDCKKCKLCQHRTNVVFGVGDPNAKLIFVGEGPGADEDAQGEPFVGRAGQLLNKMILAMGLKREQCYICNVVKCRPPQNRDPEPDEIAACEPFLKKQLSFIKPQVIVGLGRHACQTLLGTDIAMSKLRGRWHKYEDIDFMPTFHPAYLLRNPPAKKFVWEDLQEVIKRLAFAGKN
jgi:uracil-DNA glycosylase family 4